MLVQTRRRFLTTLSLAVAGGLIGPSRASGAEGAVETTTLRLTRTPALCVAPLYVAEELLRAEGFDIRYVATASATERVVRNWRRVCTTIGILVSLLTPSVRV